ncbi:lipid-A-disaccharide synthase [Wenzhouxiangella sp. EGI_FJ10305]|uniref:lipid-A-disaccharide synthase n=1 Tax=Wenzhouxiangella sp. EGI_FJ10305 TaxID=3243768 RepID=UPI0035DAB2C8
MNRRPPRIVLVAGEASGDALGASLARRLKEQQPDIEMAGVAGEAMRDAGVMAWFDLDELNVMGLTEVLRHLPRLFRLRRALRRRILEWQPDVFIGIDAPDFNLGLARRLRAQGLRTVQYVAPTVWAWRPGRAASVARSADLLLTLFPFEPALFRAHGLSSRFVGHPLADEIAAQPRLLDGQSPKSGAQKYRIALLPGSRRGEIERHADLMAETAGWLRRQRPDLELTMLLAREAHRDLMGKLVGQRLERAGVEIVCAHTREGLAAADVAVSASGTATLEAFLLECPLVVYYRLAPATYWLLRGLRLVRSQFIALPNILQGRALVPEFVQEQAQPQALGREALAWIDDPARLTAYQQAAEQCRRELAANASQNAAKAVLEMIDHDDN